MNGLINFIKDHFSAFIEVMLLIPSEFQIRYVSEVVVLVLILALGLAAIFLCDRLMTKYNLGFAASVLLSFLILSLTLGLMGFFMSIPRLFVNVSDTFLVVCVGSPIFNLALGVVTSLGNRLPNYYPKAGVLLLCGGGFLFAWILLITFSVYFLGLYNY